MCDNPNATDVPRLIKDFQAASASAEEEIGKRARKNRRGAQFCREFLLEQQIEGIETGMDCTMTDSTMDDKTFYLRQDPANYPSALLAARLASRRTDAGRKRCRSDSTSQEDE
jgi:hypothetical protein